MAEWREHARLTAHPAEALSKQKKNKELEGPKLPCSSLSSPKSLRHLRHQFHVPDDVEMIVPSPTDRANRPPKGYFTLYESVFHECFLWFPIPRRDLTRSSELQPRPGSDKYPRNSSPGWNTNSRCGMRSRSLH
ncbi:unnamed protein product [Arabis nemorensis]|uniref:Uncharacterized protein n=1 Tax=Arabis nemorensis TaxID=586526 RepID=A0A565BJ05_9BRAS|nr:unnamed protein product [Arabis nemorensis]